MSADVLSHQDWFSWSLNQLSREFGIARETVIRRLTDAGVNPSGERRGFPVYRVKEAAAAILLFNQSKPGFNNNPDAMSPKEQRDYWAGQNEKIKNGQLTNQLTNIEDARQQMAEIAKTGLQVLETLPDVLERDFDLPPEIIIGVENKIDVLRELWAEQLIQ